MGGPHGLSTESLEAVTLLRTESPEAVTRLRLSQNVACGFPALRSSKVDSQDHTRVLKRIACELNTRTLKRLDDGL